MADSDAVRSRRKRLHAAGDHSMCRRDCCGRPALVAVGSESPPAEVPPSEVFDPRAALVRLARRLQDAHEADPADAAVARELRMTLQALGAAGSDDGLAGFWAEFRGA